MTSLPSGTHIWLVASVTDMRKSFNGLGELVQHALSENPFSGLPAVERLAARQSQSKLLLASLHEWLVEKSATLSKNPV